MQSAGYPVRPSHGGQSDWSQRTRRGETPACGPDSTRPAAWDFIAEQLQDESTQIAVIDLEKPPNEKGYVLKISVTEGTIYVKLQMGRENVVIGRSFHL